MGRRRTNNLNLPPRMHLKGGAYYYVTTGKPRRWIFLSKDLGEAKLEWAKLEQAPVPGEVGVFKAVAEHFRQDYIPKRAAKTQAEYDRALDRLLEVFGDMALDAILPTHVQTYVERRSAKVAANREKALLSALWNWARAKGYTSQPNPCAGIKGNPEAGRGAYIDDALFMRVYLCADEPLRRAMLLAYYTGQRVNDVLRLRRDAVRDGCLWFKQAKTGVIVRVRVIGRLAALIRALKRPLGKVSSIYLLTDEEGRALSYHALRYRFDKARELAGVRGAEFQFRDLRGKAATDVDDIKHAQSLLGHSSSTMTEHYVKLKAGEKTAPVARRIRSHGEEL
ncbi:MAG: tyrosine-type recombinase/integrase [Gammaproteobacteria bacterium]|nr:tyrosine-type recombinase/integrase [Gammaproteobacteria bacterium]